jgi:hypothetical protein
MPATVYIHIDAGEHDFVWWAESPDVPGLTVAAPSLPELRTLIDEAVLLDAPPDVGEITYLLVTEDEPADEAPVWTPDAPAIANDAAGQPRSVLRDSERLVA